MKILFWFVALAFTAASADTRDPQAGEPYAQARETFLAQGLTTTSDPRPYETPKARAVLERKGIFVPEPVTSPAPQFPEIACWKLHDPGDAEVKCQALFLETDQRGWKKYLIVPIESGTLTIGAPRSPATVDGLPSIPPPLDKSVPQIKGSYFSVRAQLKRAGFHPARNHNTFLTGRTCADRQCRHIRILPEASCSPTGMSFCTAYWISRDGRVLKVTTIWEHPEVYFAEWSDWKSLNEDFRKEED